MIETVFPLAIYSVSNGECVQYIMIGDDTDWNTRMFGHMNNVHIPVQTHVCGLIATAFACWESVFAQATPTASNAAELDMCLVTRKQSVSGTAAQPLHSIIHHNPCHLGNSCSYVHATDTSMTKHTIMTVGGFGW